MLSKTAPWLWLFQTMFFRCKILFKIWAAYDTPRHRVILKKGFIKAASQLGFEVVKTKPFLDSFYISMMSEKYKQSLFYFLKGLFIGASNLFSFSKNKLYTYVLKP